MAPSNTTSASVNDTSELPTNMQNSQAVFSSSHRDWCAIISTSVISCGICTVGFTLLAYNDASMGLVLLFVGGSILTLAVCAALGKYQSKNKKQLEDRPPSYRVSWRRSFMRRVRRANNQIGEEPTLQVSDAPSQSTAQLPVPGHGRLPSSDYMLNLSASSLVTCVEGDTVYAPDKRRAQSLTNIVDPPRYEDALISMDEAAKRKLKSELCLPCSNRF